MVVIVIVDHENSEVNQVCMDCEKSPLYGKVPNAYKSSQQPWVILKNLNPRLRG